MKSFAETLMPVAVASILCGVALAGGDKGDHMKMMDSNGDGQVTSAEHARAAKTMFTKMDANSDGKVTAAEMDAAHPLMKGSQDRMAKGDTRHEDGHDKENAADQAHGQSRGKMMGSAQKIAAIDTDGDGTLTAAEHAMGSQKMFTRMDANGDGTLTAQELNQGHRTMMQASDE